MIEAHVRPRVQHLFDTFAYQCITLGLTPNTLTLTALLLGIIATLFLITHSNLLALICLLSSGLCDVLDGTVARLTNTSHPFGAYIDLISDRMVESSLILGFAFLYPHHYLIYILFLISVILHFSTFLAAGALFKNSGPKSMHYDRSIIERAEVFVIFACMIIAPHYQEPLLLSITGIIFIDGISRIHRVWNYVKETGEEAP